MGCVLSGDYWFLICFCSWVVRIKLDAEYEMGGRVHGRRIGGCAGTEDQRRCRIVLGDICFIFQIDVKFPLSFLIMP